MRIGAFLVEDVFVDESRCKYVEWLSENDLFWFVGQQFIRVFSDREEKRGEENLKEVERQKRKEAARCLALISVERQFNQT